MKRILVFETNLDGHRLEFIHHIYEKAITDNRNRYVFILPNKFKEKEENLIWNENENISFVTIEDEIIDSIEKGGMYQRAFSRCKILFALCKKYETDRVVLISLMHFFPFILFFPFGLIHAKISGIVYSLFFYEKGEISIVRYWIMCILYKILALNRFIDNIFILNDKNGANLLNNKYKVSKFHYLPDPVPNVDYSKVKNIRNELKIGEDQIVYLHFGALTKRKGTLIILDSLNIIDKEDLDNKVFVFAGKVFDDIRLEFYERVKSLECKARIIVLDDFIPYEKLFDLCYSCDFLLIPYLSTNASSGVLGYAACFKKQVIGPKKGIIGNIIREHNLGLVLDRIERKEFAEAILSSKKGAINTDYVENHLPSVFSTILLFNK